ncbi:MAG: hypothetical protein ACMUIL_08060 [bacterium]
MVSLLSLLGTAERSIEAPLRSALASLDGEFVTFFRIGERSIEAPLRSALASLVDAYGA